MIPLKQYERTLGPHIRSKVTYLYRSAKRDYQLYLLLLPVVGFFVIFKYFPIYGLRMAFQNFLPVLGFENSPYVGLQNFLDMFDSYQFASYIKNTLWLSFYQLAVSTPIPLAFALLLNVITREKFKKTIQNAAYAPHFISTVVLVGMLKLFFSPNYGMVNQAITSLGGDAINFFGKSSIFPSLYVWSGVWQETGWNAIIYLAALSAISPELHEAAMIDGASRFKRVLFVDFPGLLPTFTILLIMNFGKIMSLGFEKVYIMQTPLNLATSETIETFSYKIGIEKGNYGLSAAVSLFNSVINFAMVMGVNAISRRVSETSLW